MIPSLGHGLAVLQLYFVAQFSLQRVFYILSVLIATYPLFKLHLNQLREPRQPRETAWLRSIHTMVYRAFGAENEHPDYPPEAESLGPDLARKFCRDLEQLYHLLGINNNSTQLFPEPHTILCTPRLDCLFCTNNGHPPTLRRHRDPQKIDLLDENFRWTKAILFVAYCARCQAEYYPDRITYRPGSGATHSRLQRLECNAAFLRVSKHGIWMDRRIALAQENMVLHLHSGWSSFAEWLNATIGAEPHVTTRQSQRLYFEHFARRLLIAHGLEHTFTVAAHSDARTLAESVRNAIGRDGGIVAGSMDHGCIRCTHLKRYTSDLIAEGIVLDANQAGVIDAPADPVQSENPPTIPSDMPSGLPSLPEQQVRQPGTARGYTRLATMDGKNIPHRKCAVSTCTGPLVNYKNGRFCKDHLGMHNICGIIPCGRPLHSDEAVTCALESHREWHQKYLNRFSRLSFPGVQRVIRRQTQQQDETGTSSGPTLQADLPALDGVAGKDVIHTFRAGSTYCLQTVQWSCGCPIGWGKCYRSESSPQVLGILNRIWENFPESRPSFLAYDDACNLLRHIVTQDPNSPWFNVTKLIVDAWHYIGHQASDILCRIWCNPAPANGSQPDLIIVQVDENGRTHKTRAFNTETAEQLNSWLTSYEAQLRQMSNVNYDFVVHVLMLLYKELVEKRMAKKNEALSDEFWQQVDSTD
ncbi:hypothetical protein R3P38DRAFT_2917807 [Favolaschia claudopus]|uniref:CxC5 like cysteine cluster associated with KDZ domain-containing protein n=1 Tax=Favolaschia claudopus TaxID=2862362 RepID=A0AAW0C3Y9_9AGAR